MKTGAGAEFAEARNQTIKPYTDLLLHDNRARTLTEAILWHDGEALTSRQRFQALSNEDRAALLVFLRSLKG